LRLQSRPLVPMSDGTATASVCGGLNVVRPTADRRLSAAGRSSALAVWQQAGS
jgi:hypothetical protein